MKKLLSNSIVNLFRNIPYEAGINKSIPLVMRVDLTLDQVIEENKSLARFGDGEFELLFGRSSIFEIANTQLSQNYRNVLIQTFLNLLLDCRISLVVCEVTSQNPETTGVIISSPIERE